MRIYTFGIVVVARPKGHVNLQPTGKGSYNDSNRSKPSASQIRSAQRSAASASCSMRTNFVLNMSLWKVLASVRRKLRRGSDRQEEEEKLSSLSASAVCSKSQGTSSGGAGKRKLVHHHEDR